MHKIWPLFLPEGGVAIDATCGNGHDTVVLAKLLRGRGSLSAYDVQEAAIEATRLRLMAELSAEERVGVMLRHRSHTQFEEREAHLIVYNLGYLPGSDKKVMTQCATTHESLLAATALLLPGGAISLLLYPGHEEGAKEEHALLEFASTLPSTQWNCHHLRLINRKKAPSLLLLQKKLLL